MMLRRLPTLVLLAASTALLPGGGAPVSAAPHARAAGAVVMQGMAFAPARVHVGLGEDVTWTNEDGFAHTVTSDQKFWDGGPVAAGASYTRAFSAAGTFAYHCKIHPTMHGRVAVPLAVKGSPATGWTLRWATTTAPKARDYDVQLRGHGTTVWHAFRSNTTAASAHFVRPGTWQVRARESNTRAGASSGWSPVLSLAVT